MPKYPYAIWLLAFIGVGWLWIGPFQSDINNAISGSNEVDALEAQNDTNEEVDAAKLPDFPLYYAFNNASPEDEKVLQDLAEELIVNLTEGKALEIIKNLSDYRPKFVKVMPTEYRRALAEIEMAQKASGIAAE